MGKDSVIKNEGDGLFLITTGANGKKVNRDMTEGLAWRPRASTGNFHLALAGAASPHLLNAVCSDMPVAAGPRLRSRNSRDAMTAERSAQRLDHRESPS